MKPASQTAYLTELVVRRIIESGILPEGSLQLLCRQRRRPARPADRAGLGGLHRLGATPPGCCAPTPTCCTAAVQLRRRGRLAQLLDPRPRRGPGDPEFDLFVKGVVARDDGQGRPEVHRDPPRDRARGDRRRRRRGDLGPAREDHGRQPRRRVRPDGRAGQPRAARGGPQGDPVAAQLRRDRVRRPRPRGGRRRRRRARRLPVPGPAPGARRARSSRTTSSRSARSAPC